MTNNKPVYDFEHMVTEKIDKFAGFDGFPKMEDYGITKDDVDDYLFEKQAILDDEANLTKKYTICGTLIVLPVIAISAFSEGVKALLIGVGAGLLLCLLYVALKRLFDIAKLKKVALPGVEHFVRDILAFKE